MFPPGDRIALLLQLTVGHDLEWAEESTEGHSRRDDSRQTWARKTSNTHQRGQEPK